MSNVTKVGVRLLCLSIGEFVPVETPVPAMTSTCSKPGTRLTEVPRCCRTPSAMPFIDAADDTLQIGRCSDQSQPKNSDPLGVHARLCDPPNPSGCGEMRCRLPAHLAVLWSGTAWTQ
jgi:hypothetical protein